MQKLIGKGEQFDVRRWLGRADHLGIELVELAEAALLRAFVAEQGPVGGDLERRILLPALAQKSARDARGEFGTQSERITAAILERIHLLRDDIGGFAERAREDRGRFEHGHLDPAEAVEPAHMLERLDNAGETLRLFAQHALGAADGFGCFDLGHVARGSSRSSRHRREGDAFASAPLPFQGMLEYWSGRQDSNLRPLDPQSNALPGCATPRPRPGPLKRPAALGKRGIAPPGPP